MRIINLGLPKKVKHGNGSIFSVLQSFIISFLY